jgi:inward rectifier potassium channel
MSAPTITDARIEDPRDLGFGSVVGGANEKRLLNRDGTFNPRRDGMSFLASLNAYHFFLTISWKKFFATVAGGYLAANIVFALLYLE